MKMPPRAVHGRDFVYYRRIVQRDPCSYCGGRGGTKDHIIPKPRHGPPINLAENLTGACRECNTAKANLDLLGFLFERRWGVDLRQAYLDDVMMKMVGYWMP